MVFTEIKPFREFGMKCYFHFSKGQPGFCSVEGNLYFSWSKTKRKKKKSWAQNKNSSKFHLVSVCNQAGLSFTDMLIQTLQHTKGLPAIHSCHMTNRRASPIPIGACIEKKLIKNGATEGWNPFMWLLSPVLFPSIF